MQKLKSKRTKLGFTLMELMVAVAIMVIMFGVGAPATKVIQNRLAWKKANGVAKEIFMVAQNQATHMRSNNTLELKGVDTSGSGIDPLAFQSFASEVEKKTNHKVVTKPSDYTQSNAKYKNLYYVPNSESGAISYIVPNITQESITGSYIIEVNPKTGDVYGVFYSETLTSAELLSAYEKGTKTSSGTALSADVFRPESNRKKYVLNDKEHMIGYYGGNEAGLSKDNAGHNVTIKAFNKEQLYVKVHVPNASYTNIKKDNFAIDFILNDQHNNRVIVSTTSAASTPTEETAKWRTPIIAQAEDGKTDVYLILDDSINSTAHTFSSLYGSSLTAGDDITITAQVRYLYTKDGETKYISTELNSSTGSVTTNSMFGNGTEISEDPLTDDNGTVIMDGGHPKYKDVTIKVSNCRHLRNLANFRSSNTWAQNNKELRTTQLVTVEQTKDIDFAKLRDSSKAKNYICPIMGNNAYSTLSFSSPSTFSNIDNKWIFGTADSSSSYVWTTGAGGDGYAYSNPKNTYNGKGNEIQNLIVFSNSNTGSGLFGKFNARLIDVHVRNIRVTATSSKGRSYVGGLIGWAGPQTYVNKCGVYCSAYKETGKYPFDTNASKVTDYNKNLEFYCIEGARDTGGLIGRMVTEYNSGTSKYEGGTVENSFAAINVKCVDISGLTRAQIENEGSPYNSFGGLIGRMLVKSNNCKSVVRNCYSSGTVTGTYDSGGLVGVTGGVIDNCYSTSTLKLIHKYNDVAFSGGGITGKLMKQGTVSNCIFYGTIEKNDTTSAWKSQNVGVIVDEKRATDQAGRTVKNCKYLAIDDDDYNTQYDSTDDPKVDDGGYYGATKCTYAELTAGVSRDASKSYGYSKSLKDKAFPFKFLSAMGGGSDVNYHYGDWYYVKEPKIYPRLVYYEIYKNRSNGSTSIGFNNATVVFNETGETAQLPSLCDQAYLDSGWYVLQAGYGIIAADSKSVDISRNGSSTKYTVDLKASPTTSFSLNDTNIGVYTLNGTAYGEKDSKNEGTFFDNLTLYDGKTASGTQFYYNGDVANQVAEGSKPATPAAVEVRTAKQFNALGTNSYLWGNIDSKQITYNQSLDIDYSTYEDASTLSNAPIGSSVKAFTNSFNGCGNEIHAYNLRSAVSSSNKAIGVFGQAGQTSVIQNVHLVAKVADDNGYITTTTTSKTANNADCSIGGLVGYLNKGTVNNCSVSGYKVVAEGSGTKECYTVVGGLVGTSTGTITNSTAVNREVSNATDYIYRNTSGSGKASETLMGIGGLIGSYLAGSIDNSYSGGKLRLSLKCEIRGLLNFFGDSSVAGISGCMINIFSATKDDMRSITNCYSYCQYEVPSYPVLIATGVYSQKVYGAGDFTDTNTCYYVTDVAENVNNTEFRRFGTAKKLAELATLFAADRPTSANSFPWDTTLKDKTPEGRYPFKAVVRDGNGDIVHYGNWVIEDDITKKQAQSAPSAPSASSKTATKIVLNSITGGHGDTLYAVNSENTAPVDGWQESTTFDGLTPGTNYYFFAKYSGDTDYYESPASAGTLVTTNKADQNAPSAPTAASTSSNKIVLNAVAAGHGRTLYAKNTSNSAPSSGWQESTEFAGLTPGTDYYFFAKYEGDAQYNPSNPSTGRKITTPKLNQNAPSAPTVSSVSYTTVKLNAVAAGKGRTLYAKNTSNSAPTSDSAWQESTEFTELSAGTNYYFFAKYEGNAQYNASPASSGTLATTKIAHGYFGVVRTSQDYKGNKYVKFDGYSYNINGSDGLKELDTSSYNITNATAKKILGNTDGLSFSTLWNNYYIFWNVDDVSGLWKYQGTLLSGSIQGIGKTQTTATYNINFYVSNVLIANVKS